MTEITLNRPPRNLKHPPGPRGHWFWGVADEFQRDALNAFVKISQNYGDITRFRSGFWYTYCVTHPDYVKHILQDNHLNYRKGIISDLFLKPLLGDGLLTSEGSFWLRQRRLMQPAFHRQRLAQFGTIMTDATQTLLARWQTWHSQGQGFDVAEEMMRLTLSIVGQTLFSADVSGTADAVGPALTVAQEHVNYRSTHVFSLPEKYPTPRNLRFRRAVASLDHIVYGLIEERRRTGEDPGDLLSMLLNARDEQTGEGMSNQQLRDEVMTLFLAGHETTANALTWTWYLLAQHPQVADKLRAELAYVLAGRIPTVADLPALRYTTMVIEEAMRLYPPAWALSRDSLDWDEIGGYTIPPKSTINIIPYITHRHPDFWPNPETFDPERFSPERSAGRPRYAYFPFGGGPRQCIGSNFAMMEATLVLATIAQLYRVEVDPGHPIALDPLITLRPKHGIRVHLERLATGILRKC